MAGSLHACSGPLDSQCVRSIVTFSLQDLIEESVFAYAQMAQLRASEPQSLSRLSGLRRGFLSWAHVSLLAGRTRSAWPLHCRAPSLALRHRVMRLALCAALALLSLETSDGRKSSRKKPRPQRPAPYEPSLYDAACTELMPMALSSSAQLGDGQSGFFLERVLGRVDGLTRAKFFAEHWNRRPLWVRPQLEHGRPPATPLLSLAQIDAVIEANPEAMRNGRGLKFAMAGQIIGQHLGEGTVVDVVAARGGFGSGATVIIHEIERLHPPVTAVAQALESELGVFASANMYLTPHTKRAFDPHFDLEDTFIQQVSGAKTWRVWSPPHWPAPLPLRAQTEGKNAAPPATASCATVTLEPGDVMYVPRGHSHVAVPTPAPDPKQAVPSVHLTNTMHVQEFTWENLLRLVVATGDEVTYARPAHQEAGVEFLKTFYRQSTEAMSSQALKAGVNTVKASQLPGLRGGVGRKGAQQPPPPEVVQLGASLREPYDLARCGEPLTVEVVLLAGLRRIALERVEFREIVSPFWPAQSDSSDGTEQQQARVRSGTTVELEAGFTERVAAWQEWLEPDAAAAAAGCTGAGGGDVARERARAVLAQAAAICRWEDLAATARALYLPSFQRVE